MSDSPYFLEWLARERLAEARARGARDALVGSLRRRSPRARSRLGGAATAAGRWLLRGSSSVWAREASRFTGGPAT